jgi:CTP:molybdopterin cytidylyltransferase MocA
VLALTEETADMRATIEHGLRWLEERIRPAPDDRWLLLPADHPALDAAVVRCLLEARALSERSIVLPAFAGKRGHPALIDWSHVAAVRALPPGQGLNAYFRQHKEDTLEVPVASGDVLCDLDTPEDYARLCARWQQE